MKKTLHLIFAIIPTILIACVLNIFTIYNYKGLIKGVIEKPRDFFMTIALLIFAVLSILSLIYLFRKQNDNNKTLSKTLLYGHLIFWILFIVTYLYMLLFKLILGIGLKIENTFHLMTVALGLYFLACGIYNLRSISNIIKPKYIYYLCTLFAMPLLIFETVEYVKSSYNDYITINSKEELYTCSHHKSITDINLALAELSLTDLDRFTHFPNLKNITMIYCSTNNIPESWQKMKNVVKLAIYNCSFSKIPPNIYKLSSLEQLIIAGDSLQEISTGISQLQNLKNLSFGDHSHTSSQNLSNLPDEISKLDSLKYLSIWASNITTLPNGLCELKKLEEIDALSTNLKNIPICLKNNKKLKILIYKDDGLDSLKVIFGDMFVVQ
jgi:hypothetical protein